MSLSIRIKTLSEEEKIVFMSMLNKCLKILNLWADSMTDKNKTDKQCEFASNKLDLAENDFRQRFNYLNMDNFRLSDISFCTK